MTENKLTVGESFDALMATPVTDVVHSVGTAMGTVFLIAVLTVATIASILGLLCYVLKKWPG